MALQGKETNSELRRRLRTWLGPPADPSLPVPAQPGFTLLGSGCLPQGAVNAAWAGSQVWALGHGSCTQCPWASLSLGLFGDSPSSPVELTRVSRGSVSRVVCCRPHLLYSST